MQVDLIDMRHRPDGSYNWIGHYMGHWYKVHVLFPLMQKCAEEVALSLVTKVFCYFGLQSDNGREFVNAIIRKVVDDWPGEVTIVNGRARHPSRSAVASLGPWSHGKNGAPLFVRLAGKATACALVACRQARPCH